ncbi:hypothetical protein AAG747_12365 [Rapidithrix thailandica]|uniref:Uncharacterized protein n=1 Tax=Rapidithrix thailandica TaxID=413964 RepID=A0AAW9S6Y3_9BACT
MWNKTDIKSKRTSYALGKLGLLGLIGVIGIGCSSPEEAQEKELIYTVGALKNESTDYYLEKNVTVKSETVMNPTGLTQKAHCVMEWRVTPEPKGYKVEILRMKYDFPASILHYAFDTDMDSVEIVSEWPGTGFGISEKGRNELEEALKKLKKMKGFVFRVVKNDSGTLEIPEFNLSWEELETSTPYNPAEEIKMHLAPKYLLSVFENIFEFPKGDFKPEAKQSTVVGPDSLHFSIPILKIKSDTREHGPDLVRSKR